MHDVVAHSLSVIVVQADGARYAAAADPAAVGPALETIATTGRAALADMRRMLGLLRAEPAAERPAAAAAGRRRRPRRRRAGGRGSVDAELPPPVRAFPRASR